MNVRPDHWQLSLPPIRYLLVLWLFVLSAVAYLDRTNISIAGIHIGREFAVDNVHLGRVFSAFLIGYAAFQVPVGLLARRLGPRLILGLGFAWCGVFAVLMTLVSPTMRGALPILALVRFGLGAGEAAMYPAASQFVERWFPVCERGKANGLIFAGIGIGAGLTPPLVTAIILRHGWRASFWFSALACAVAGLVWYLAARDTPEEHPLVGNEERALIAGQRNLTRPSDKTGNSADGSKPAIPWARIFTSKAVYALTASYFAFGYVAWIFFAWFYIYMAQVRGLNLKASAAFSMLPFIAMTIGCLGGGVVSDWIATRYGLRMGRCLLPALSLAVTAVLLVVGSRAQSPAAAGVILACGAGVLYIAQSGFWAVSADIAGEHVGVVSGLMNMGGQAAGACTASLTPLIAAHFGWEMSFVTAAAIALVGSVAWLAIDPTKSWRGSDANPEKTATARC
jgi:ACS family glucarate transporter-like MFS transporter